MPKNERTACPLRQTRTDPGVRRHHEMFPAGKRRCELKKSLVVALALVLLVAFVPAASSAPRTVASIGSWQTSATAGFLAGKANNSAGPIVSYQGKIYSGVSNEAGASVRVLEGDAWVPASGATLGTAKDTSVARMIVFRDKLYAGTFDMTDGFLIYRYDGGTTWTQVTAGRGIYNTHNMAVGSMAVFNDRLYVGTINISIGITGVGSDGAELYSYDGATWTREQTGGFGDATNIGITSLSVYGGRLYAGTARCQFTTQLVDMNTIKITAVSKGCQLRTMEGALWPVVADNGITDARNIAATSMADYGGKLYVGTANGDGDTTITGIMSGTMTIGAFNYQTNGASVYTFDGANVQQVVRGGFESKDDVAVTDMLAATVSGKDLLLAPVVRTNGPGMLKVFDGSSWFNGADPGFGSANNSSIAGLCVDGATTYAGTANGTTGCEIWIGAPASSPFDAVKTWYLAEGCTNGGFETWVLVQNPGDAGTSATMTFMTKNGTVNGPTLTLPPGTRQTVNVANYVPNTWDVSTVVVGSDAIVVERAMYWNNRKGGHDSIGVTSASPTWMLAEGSTNAGFETWVLVQNPGAQIANVKLYFMTKTGKKDGPSLQLQPGTRQSVNVGATVPNEYDVSTSVTSDQPVIAERSVYWNNRQGGTESVGVTSASSTWYMAEGCTNGGFETWILVQNPGSQTVSATVTYMTPTGEKPGPILSVAPGTRQSVNVADTVKNEWDVSTRVDASYPVVCERAVYWNNRIEGHDSVGVTTPAPRWFLAEGSTNGFETWVLIQNPGAVEANAKMTFMTPKGAVDGPTIKLAPKTRQSVNVALYVPNEYSVSTKVVSDQPVICERAMYWKNRTGGHDSIGAAF